MANQILKCHCGYEIEVLKDIASSSRFTCNSCGKVWEYSEREIERTVETIKAFYEVPPHILKKERRRNLTNNCCIICC